MTRRAVDARLEAILERNAKEEARKLLDDRMKCVMVPVSVSDFGLSLP
jgi:hypothetical protein